MQCDCVRRVRRGRKCISRASQVGAKSRASRLRAREHRVEQQCSHNPARVLLRGRVVRSPSPKEFWDAAHSHIAKEFVRCTRAARDIAREFVRCNRAARDIAKEFVRCTRAARHIAREFVRCTRTARHIILFRNRESAPVQGASNRVHQHVYPRAMWTNSGNCAHRVAQRGDTSLHTIRV